MAINIPEDEVQAIIARVRQRLGGAPQPTADTPSPPTKGEEAHGIYPTVDAAVEAAPPDRRGTAGGLVILARLVGLAVGLSGLTAWAIYRFDVLRRTIELPPVGAAGYEEAASAAQAELSATALSETFLFSAGVTLLALAAALLLRRVPDRPSRRSAEGRQ